MKGKRPFRRKPSVDLYPVRPLGPGPRKELRRAHLLLESGNHTNAAVLFERLARSVHDRMMLRMAAHLYLQTARARLLGGEAEAGEEALRLALQLLDESGRDGNLPQVGRRVLEELTSIAKPQFVHEISDWLKGKGIVQPTESENELRGAERKAMLRCPLCEGTIHPAYLKWFDKFTAECPYCGSAIKTDA